MKILSVDTSTRRFSLAISHHAQIITYRNLNNGKTLSSTIVPSINRLLKKADISLKQIDGFAVGIGPGAFTSLRVGLSTMKSLAYANGKPIVGIPSLDIIAAEANTDGVDHLCVITDARRNLLYEGYYKVQRSRISQEGKYRLCSIDDVLRDINDITLFTGDGVKIYHKEIKRCKYALFENEKKWYPEARWLAKLAYTKLQKKQYDDINRLVPLYLYPEDCQVTKK